MQFTQVTTGFAVLVACALWITTAAPAGAVGTLLEYPIKAGANPRGLTLSTNGNSIQFAESGLGTLGTIGEKGRYTRNYLPLAKGQPTAVTMGAQNGLWITEAASNAIEHYVSGKVTVFPLPRGSTPRGITGGSHAVWFCEAGSNKIGRMTFGGFLSQFSIPTAHSNPARITIGPDGDVWFTEQSGNKVGRLVPTTGQITQINLPAGSTPVGITTGPDGNMWVTEPGLGQVAAISPSTGRLVTTYPVGTKPYDITAGTDGLLWLTDPGSNSVISLATDGSTISYPVPTAHSGVLDIADGPRGQIWFSEQNANRIGRLDNTTPHTQYVSVGVRVVEQDPPRLALGSTVQWTFFGPGTQSATDTTGMGLYDSGPQSFVSTFTHEFDAAGDYTFASTRNSALTGAVKVMPRVTPSSVTAGTPATVQFATGPAATGFQYQVQVRTPGQKTFSPLVTTTQPTTDYTPSAAGTYEFEARLVDTLTPTPTSSGWSPAITLTAN
jgi:virginiamycin B lyase